MGTVGIPGGRQIVLLLQARVEKLLAGVVDDLSVPVDEVEVALPVGEGHVLADLLDAAEVHVHQQHTALHIAPACQLHMAAEGDHPVVPRIRILKQVLHMGRGKMQILNALHGGGEPPLAAGRHTFFQLRQRCGGDQSAVLVEYRQRHQHVPVLGVQQLQRVVQLLRHAVLLQIRVLDDPVIHRVRYPHHIAQVAVQTPVHLRQHPLAVLRRHLVGGGGEAQQQRYAQKQHTHHRHGGKGDRQDHLDAGAVVQRLPPRFPAGRYFLHRRLPSLSVISPHCGTWWASPRSAA